MTFKAQRGTNISHWLSQSEKRGEARKRFFTESDVRRIADWGMDHIRLPVDEEQLWHDDGTQDQEAFDLLDAALDWAERAGLNVVVDLHILRSHSFGQVTEPVLFTDPAEAERFAELWRQLSARMKRRSTAQVAYELMNEPVATDAADWNRVAMVALQAIRELEPERVVYLGSNRWNAVDTFDLLEVPADPRLVLTFHYYLPMLVTHHQAGWWREGGQYAGPVHYPGVPVHEQDLAALEEPFRGVIAGFNEHYDRERMAADLRKPLAVAAETGLPLYCGEFGVYEVVEPSVRAAWYKDVIAVFDEHGISWANWDYKGGFGLVDKAGNPTGVAEMMLG